MRQIAKRTQSLRQLRKHCRGALDRYSKIFLLMAIDARVRRRQKHKAASAMRRYRRKAARREARSLAGLEGRQG